MLKNRKAISLVVFLLIVVFVGIFLLVFNLNQRENFSGKLSNDEILVVDSVGNEVIVEKNPKRIATIFSPATQIVAMLGDADKIMAISSGELKNSFLVSLYPSLSEVRTPKGGGGFNFEELIREPAPDIIFCDPSLILDSEVKSRLEELGIPVVVVSFSSIKEQKEAVMMIGEILGKESLASRFCEDIDSSLSFVKEKISEGNVEGVSLFHSVNELLRTDVSGSVTSEVISELGIEQVGVKDASSFNGTKNYIGLEELFLHNPDYLIINGYEVFDYALNSEVIGGLSAAKEGNILILPVGVSRWGQAYSMETSLFVKWLGKSVYPELFVDIDMREEIKSFYREFFGVDLSDESIDGILAGNNFN